MECSKCGRNNLTEEDFYKTSKGYFYSYCKVCYNKRAAANRRISRLKPENRIKDRKNGKLRRSNPANRANIIFTDSKSSDKKRGRKFDLTLSFIKDLIKNPCSYCGETELQMTLDRTDNNIGHLQSNVVAACIRCNLIRKAMPYKAWLCLLPGLQEAREKGLFLNWMGK